MAQRMRRLTRSRDETSPEPVLRRSRTGFKDKKSPTLAYVFGGKKLAAHRGPDKTNVDAKVAPNVWKVHNTFRAPVNPDALFSEPHNYDPGGRLRADAWYEAILGLDESFAGHIESSKEVPESTEEKGQPSTNEEDLFRKVIPSSLECETTGTRGRVRGRKSPVEFLRVGKRLSERQRKINLVYYKTRKSSTFFGALERHRKRREAGRRAKYSKDVLQHEYTYTISLGRLSDGNEARSEISEESPNLTYQLGDFSTKWLQHIAKLKQTYFKGAISDQALEPPCLDPAAEGWAQDILEGGKSPAELQSRIQKSWRHHRVWEEALTWLLENDAGSAVDFLKITHQAPLPPRYIVGQALEYLILRYTSEAAQRNDDARDHLQAICRAIPQLASRPSHDKLWIDGSHLTWLLDKLAPDIVAETLADWDKSTFQIPISTRLHAIRRLTMKDSTIEAAIVNLGRLRPPAPAYCNHDLIRMACFSILRRTARRPNGHQMCLEAISNLVSIGVNLNVQLCTMAMLNAVRAGDSQAAFNVYHLLQENGIEPDKYLFSVLIQACKLVVDDGGRLASIIDTALRKGILLTSPHVASDVLDALFIYHNKAERHDTFKLMLESYDQLFDRKPLLDLELMVTPHTPQPSTIMASVAPALGTIIRSFLAHEKPTVRRVVQLYRQCRHLALTGQQTFSDMWKSDHVPNAFVAYLAGQRHGLRWAAEVIENMSRDALEEQPLQGLMQRGDRLPKGPPTTTTQDPEAQHARTTERSVLEASREETLGTTSSSYRRTGFSAPTQITLSILHRSLCQQAQPRNQLIIQAERVFEQMLSQGGQVHRKSWTTMMYAYKRVRDYEAALRCIESMKELGYWDHDKGLNSINMLQSLRRRDSQHGSHHSETRKDWVDDAVEELQQLEAQRGS
ncbi:hypothetical protein CAC42_6611 [Sphaceloma murrayae]|uniref:Uncharacterized protein n=1 Tax=Sphaceloma murrayae TaxID=2082308 RepID=A0A2K1QFY4_9PEZI|nr:hypothetical protein CAC42_6611 [Sphaceloma murrayae]